MATRRLPGWRAATFVGRAGDLLYNVDTGVMRYSDGVTPGGQPIGGGGGSLPSGGTTGQVLAKQSNANGDADWEDATGGGGYW